MCERGESGYEERLRTCDDDEHERRHVSAGTSHFSDAAQSLSAVHWPASSVEHTPNWQYWPEPHSPFDVQPTPHSSVAKLHLPAPEQSLSAKHCDADCRGTHWYENVSHSSLPPQSSDVAQKPARASQRSLALQNSESA